MSDFTKFKYNTADAPVRNDDAGAANGAVTTTMENTGSLTDPGNPAFWLLAIGVVTIGLVAASTHVRVGNVSAGFDVGSV